VIPRFTNDRHFPNPIWGDAKRDGGKRMVDIAALRKAVAAALS
jgi:diadenosine tetraphosphate (Ap4A) HIT family hydrolase